MAPIGEMPAAPAPKKKASKAKIWIPSIAGVLLIIVGVVLFVWPGVMVGSGGAEVEELNGMTPEELKRVVAVMRSDVPALSGATPAEGGSYGLRNVDARIRLFYHQQTGLEIASGAGGTTVSFRVPLKSREEIADDEGVSG